MVPKPNAESHRQPARHLLSRCDAIADVGHYRSGRPIRELFDEDRGEMQPLPRARFDAVEWVERKADKEGNIQIGCFASIFLKQFLHYFSAVWAAGFQQELHHMTAQTRTGTGPPCLYIPET